MNFLGAFHSSKTSALNVPQLPVANGTAFSKISKQGVNFARYSQIFEKFFSRSFLAIPLGILTPGIFRIFGWIVRISGIQQFPEFMETFPGKFLYHLPLFPIFRKFWLNGKRPESAFHSAQNSWNFGSVRPEYLGPPLLLYRWFTLTGRLILVGRTEMSLSIWQNCCPQYRSSSSRLQGQGLTRITTKCVVAWVGSEQPECTVPLGTYPA